MKIKIKSNAYAGCSASQVFKDFIEANKGQWVDVETKCLFHDQYNTKQVRIMDSMVEAVQDDARVGMGRCFYCGATIERGKEEEHFEAMENKVCQGCRWFRDTVINTEYETHTNNVGQKISNTYKVYDKACTYKDGCKNMEHRKLGIDWFTESNTFFLKYPNGINFTQIDIKVKLGSYYVENSEYGYYRIHNCRKTIRFQYLNGKFFVEKYESLKESFHLDIPYAIETKLKQYLNGLKKEM